MSKVQSGMTERLELRLSPAERRRIDRAAKRAGLTVSAYLRSRVSLTAAEHTAACDAVKRALADPAHEARYFELASALRKLEG